MVDSCGRSVAVWAAMAAEALAFGTFKRAAVAALVESGVVVAEGSTLTRLLRICSSDVVMVLIEISLDLSNDSGMSKVLCVVLGSSINYLKNRKNDYPTGKYLV